MGKIKKFNRVNVLCGCGWGLLDVEDDEVPYNCPICDAAIRNPNGPEPDGDDDFDNDRDPVDVLNPLDTVGTPVVDRWHTGGESRTTDRRKSWRTE